MKIVICASVVFSDKIIEVAKYLKDKGHIVDIPFITKKIESGEILLDQYRVDKEAKGDTKYRESAKADFIKRYFGLISDCDVILVLNYDKKDVKNYIGGSVLMEMGFAYALDKKIFMLNPIPEMSYTDEITAMNPEIINRDLDKVK